MWSAARRVLRRPTPPTLTPGRRSTATTATTRPSNSLPASVATFVTESGLDAADIFIVGGTSAVSEAVADQIATAAGWDADTDNPIIRIAGDNRYETAAAGAEWIVEDAGDDLPGTMTTVIVATGLNFPDALAAGSLAHHGPHPILLAPGSSLGAGAAGALGTLDATDAVLIGAPAALAAPVVEDLDDLGIGSVRVDGDDRFETAAALADLFVDEHENGDPWGVIVVNGFQFPHALSAAPLTAWYSPILLTATDALPDATIEWTDAYEDLVDALIVGGNAAVSQFVEDALAALLTTVTS